MRRPNANPRQARTARVSLASAASATKIVVVVFAAALTLAALPAAAQPGAGDSKVDLTLFAGYRLDGDVNGDFIDFGRDLQVDEGEVFGASVDFSLNRNMQIQLLVNQQDTELLFDDGLFTGRSTVADLTLTTVHVGFVYQWTPGQVHPYVVASGGVTNVDPDLPGADSDTRLSASIGGGVKLKFSDAVGLRLEGRLFVTDVDPSFGDDERRRRRNNDEDLLVQPEGSVGVVFSF